LGHILVTSGPIGIVARIVATAQPHAFLGPLMGKNRMAEGNLVPIRPHGNHEVISCSLRPQSEETPPVEEALGVERAAFAASDQALERSRSAMEAKS
jgi:hypothetical protein